MRVYKGIFNDFLHKAKSGTPKDIDFLFSHLVEQTTVSITRFVDYALSEVVSQEGVSKIEYYLFNGTLIQRNYASLYFNRLGNWELVKEAYQKGLIDKLQAFSR